MPSKVGWGVSDQLQDLPLRRGCASDHDCVSDRLRGCKGKNKHSHNDSIRLFKLQRIFTNFSGGPKFQL